MKTNVIMKSVDRELFGIKIQQNTKEQFLSVTDLQNAFEKGRWQYGWSDKRVSDILSSIDTKERIFHLLTERGLIKAEIHVFMKMVEKEGLTKVLKGLRVYKTTGRGSNKTVMADPYIWVLLAMELNPMLYAKVIIWLTDSLIFDRIEAGSEFMPMNAAIKSVIENPDYIKFTKEINIAAFGHHQSGMRNLGSAKQLKKVAQIEKFIQNAISSKWIKTESEIIEAIRNYK